MNNKSIVCSVVKRNGSKVPFDRSKLESAIEGAFDDDVPDEQLGEMVEKVLDAILDSGTTIISTEEINDHVERTLMNLGYYDEARNFILYREQNKNIRKHATDNDTMSEYIFMNRYSRYLPRKNRRETWNEAVDRVRDMHITKYPMAEESVIWAFEQVRQKRVLPSMRSMQFGGKPITDKHARMFNCTYAPIDRISFFNESMYLLLCGCGVGFSVEFENINKLPSFKESSFFDIRYVTIEDSIEGWSDAIKELMKSYVEGYMVEFSYKKIRIAGSPIKSGGKAPGHVPLRRAIEKVRNIMDAVCKRENTKLKTIEAYDIVMHLSDAVLAGGVRRSATICLFSPDDADMMSAKTGNWFAENPQRARSNNSVKLVREETTKEHFMRIFETQKEFGEPGFYFVSNKDAGTNPCCITGDTLISTDKGEVSMLDVANNPQNYKVWTYNIDTETVEVEDVAYGALTRENANIIELELEDGEILKLTPDHKVYTENRGWIEAAKLTNEDILLKISEGVIGKPKKIKINKIRVIENQDTYDITTEHNHNFFANGVLVHNCEIGLNPYLPAGYKMSDGTVLTEKSSGFQFCNLVSINGSMLKTAKDFEIAVKAASIIGTCQAGFTEFPYLGKVTEEICKRESLLGVSITGMMDSPDIALNPEIQRQMAKVAIRMNKRISKKIGIPEAARVTCIKPEGCFIPSTRIKTLDGDMSFEEIFRDHGYDMNSLEGVEKSFLPVTKDTYVFNENGDRELITSFFVNGVDEMVKFELDDGSTVKCTPWHKFKLKTGEWKRADELDENDDIETL